MKLLLFLLSTFLSVILSNDSFVPPNGSTLEVVGTDVRARDNPCTDGRIITVLQNGQRLTSLGQSSNGCGFTWWKVRGNFGDGFVASNYLRQVSQNSQCFPVKQNSFSRVSVNWGGARQNGARCHAGIDIYTKAPGDVLAVEDGTVTNIFNFLACKDGWACQGRCGPNGKQTMAVMVHHPSLGKTFNYGEVDHDHVAVKVGQNIKKGQRIGRAGYCGMLHFEVYNGRQTANARWSPPSGQRSENPDKCARVYLNTKPAVLEDPRPWIVTRLNGKWC